jgi:arginyl-tRNA synthetase
MKQHIVDLLTRHLGSSLSSADIERLIEVPPSEAMGDFAFPCFPLARLLKKSPAQIAQELKTKMEGDAYLEKINAVSGYLNFFLDPKGLARSVLTSSSDENFGKLAFERRVVVEFASPNTNKPLHLGHLRNISIGESLA